MDFFYDASGYPFALKYNGDLCYDITNLQGDVMSIVDPQGEVVAEYEYDPYGNILTATGPLADVNPLRYRGYVYDTETQFYYLQSRYYDPEIGRFLNADAYASTGQGILGNNMFAYCGNNPIINADMEGTFFFTVLGAVVGATVGAVDAWLMGGDWEDIKRGAKAGAYSGAIAGAGVDTAVIVVASGGSMGVALGIVAGSGALSGVVGTGISTDWQADTVDYFGAAMLGAGLNMISFGTAPINGEIIRGTIPQMIDDVFLASSGTGMNLLGNVASTTIIAEASIWIYRVITEKELVEYE